MERFDYNVNPELMEEVISSIRARYGKMEFSEEDGLFGYKELADALAAKGYPIDTEKEHTQQYTGVPYYRDHVAAVVKLQHSDCCMEDNSDRYVQIFCCDKDRLRIYVNRKQSLSQTVNAIEEIDRQLPEIMHKCEQKVLKRIKGRKLKSIQQSTLKSVIETTLKGTGIQYHLSLNEPQAMLTLRLDNGLETNIHLSYKDFMEKIPHIVSTVEQLNGIMQRLGQPLRIKATYYQSKVEWTESK